nr:uncharacterized protein CI109_000611 [Kwoniella shandongensis]KAA5531039.1 hypothetical protein CI109_000611 [Kwoniella shandongensis]
MATGKDYSGNVNPIPTITASGANFAEDDNTSNPPTTEDQETMLKAVIKNIRNPSLVISESPYVKLRRMREECCDLEQDLEAGYRAVREALFNPSSGVMSEYVEQRINDARNCRNPSAHSHLHNPAASDKGKALRSWIFNDKTDQARLEKATERKDGLEAKLEAVKTHVDKLIPLSERLRDNITYKLLSLYKEHLASTKGLEMALSMPGLKYRLPSTVKDDSLILDRIEEGSRKAILESFLRAINCKRVKASSTSEEVSREVAITANLHLLTHSPNCTKNCKADSLWVEYVGEESGHLAAHYVRTRIPFLTKTDLKSAIEDCEAINVGVDIVTEEVQARLRQLKDKGVWHSAKPRSKTFTDLANSDLWQLAQQHPATDLKWDTIAADAKGKLQDHFNDVLWQARDTIRPDSVQERLSQWQLGSWQQIVKDDTTVAEEDGESVFHVGYVLHLAEDLKKKSEIPLAKMVDLDDNKYHNTAPLVSVDSELFTI